jgi:hypothetical protein
VQHRVRSLYTVQQHHIVGLRVLDTYCRVLRVPHQIYHRAKVCS